MKPIRWMLAALAVLLAQGSAEACSYSGRPPAMIHTTLPRILPEGAIVAKVELESRDVIALVGPGIRARVRKMIQGRYGGRFLIVRPVPYVAHCGDAFGNGRSGYMIAVPRGYEHGILVVHPIEVPIGSVLPDGCRVTPDLAEAVALPPAGSEGGSPPQGEMRIERLFLPATCEGR